MAVWHYEFADLLTDTTIDVVELDGVRFDDRIVQPGSFSVQMPITDPTFGARMRRIRSGRSVVYPYRDGRLWGSYLVWTNVPGTDDRGRAMLRMQGAGLGSYFDRRRRMLHDLVYTDVDQLTIARQLVVHAQSVHPNGDLGIEVGDDLSGVIRSRIYYTDELVDYTTRLKELASVEDSFEYRFLTLDAGGGVRTRMFLTGYPKLGRDLPVHTFEQPGNVTGWSISDDATSAATAFLARGESLEDDLTGRSIPLLSDVVIREDLLADGWPLLERVDDWQGVVLKADLNAHATQTAADFGGSKKVPTIPFEIPEGEATFTPLNLGDRVRLKLVNDHYPLDNGAPTFTVEYRAIGLSVQPAGRGGGKDLGALVIEDEDAA